MKSTITIIVIFFKASSADIYATLDVINLTTSGITSATAADIMASIISNINVPRYGL